MSLSYNYVFQHTTFNTLITVVGLGSPCRQPGQVLRFWPRQMLKICNSIVEVQNYQPPAINHFISWEGVYSCWQGKVSLSYTTWPHKSRKCTLCGFVDMRQWMSSNRMYSNARNDMWLVKIIPWWSPLYDCGLPQNPEPATSNKCAKHSCAI